MPFEVIAGTPCERYGARLTFRAVGGSAALAAAFGLTHHPWGAPDWVGVRVSRSGGLKVKAYHRLTDVHRFQLPAGLPAPLYPVMAALHEDAVEVYLRFGAGCTWTEFAQRCCGVLGEVQRRFSPHPRPVASAFCLSLRWQGEQLTAVSVFADYRALPDDETIARPLGRGHDGAGPPASNWRWPESGLWAAGRSAPGTACSAGHSRAMVAGTGQRLYSFQVRTPSGRRTSCCFWTARSKSVA